MKLKTFIVALAALTAVPALAQSQRDREWQGDYKPYPYNFVSLQGGAQTTFTNYDNTKLFMPMGAVSVGRMFTPVIGARLDVSGWRNKGAFRETDQSYYYNAVTYDADLLVNLSNLIWKQRYHCTNLYFIGGLGLNYAWHNGDVNALAATGAVKAPYAWKNRLFHNFRAGVQVEQSLGKNLAVNLEVTANHLGDRFNSKVGAKGDWQVNALVGLSFKFGQRTRSAAPTTSAIVQDLVEDAGAETAAAPVVVEEEKPVVEPEPEPEPVAVTKRENVKLHKVIFYDIRMSDNEDPSAILQQVADFMKQYKDVRVFAVGYADKGTGTPQLNAKYAQKRAQQFKEDLVNRYGVNAESITIDSKGDTVQPFDENDKNRCVIIDAEGVREYTIYE
ncbi:MAG: OmpA family protein [Alloprevotella sp.]|nr:OmpA family protein [Alloprevotella sp.]